MKLIRMTTEREDAVFDNQVSDLTIKPKSKIALLNASFDTETRGIDIDFSNNGIAIAVNGETNIKQIDLDDGQYNEDNYTDLFDEINRGMNATLSYATNADRGVEFKLYIQPSNKVRMGYRNSLFLTESNVFKRIKQVNTNNVYTKNNARFLSAIPGGATSPTNDSFIYYQKFIAKGTGQISCRAVQCERGDGDLLNDGFIIGVTAENMRAYTKETFDDEDFVIAIKCEANGEAVKYRTQATAGWVASALVLNPGVDDGIEDCYTIRISGGRIQAVAHQPDPVNVGQQIDTVIADTPYLFNDLYPVIALRGDADKTAVDRVKHYLTPYDFALQTVMESNLNEDLELGAVNPTRRSGTTVANQFIAFYNQFDELSIDLPRFLGFSQARFPEDGFIRQSGFEIVADQQFDYLNLSDAYLVEMLNLELDSYDCEVNKRRSLLAVVPLSNDTNSAGLVTYEASTPVFIDIKNANPLLLRNIQARIIKNDNSGVFIRGLSSMTLLIKDPDE